jgi:tRNA(Ile)-lysidine synthase TilS/MesJ
MCKLCEEKPVYEFTNKRKLCKKCFIDYFHKKVLYTIRKFNMIRQGDIIGYKKGSGFKEEVLKEMLDFANERIGFTIAFLPSKKINKIAISSSLDSESGDIVHMLIEGDVSDLKKDLPVEGNVIKPLYLFLDEEIMLYAKLRNMKFSMKKDKKDKTEQFMDSFEKKHPEVKRAVVNSILELYEK